MNIISMSIYISCYLSLPPSVRPSVHQSKNVNKQNIYSDSYWGRGKYSAMKNGCKHIDI